jgi:hypothetical protein
VTRPSQSDLRREALAERRNTCLSLRVILREPHQNPYAPHLGGLLRTCGK